MAQFEFWMTTDLKRGSSQVQVIHGQTFTQDNLGNRVGVVVLDGGEPATLNGTVTGYVIRADGGTVLVTGAVDGNKAYIDLPESAYAVPGQIQIAIRLTSGETKTVLGALNAYVQRTATGTIIDPGHVVPDIDDIIAKMDEMDEAIANANAATAAANTAAQNANNATGYITTTEATSTASAAHAQGSYLIYDGKLYQATADIAIGDSLATTGTGANIAQVTGGAMGEVSDLRSAIPSGIIYTSRMAKSGNLFPFREDVIDGKYYYISEGELVTQTSANYYGFILAVNPNTEYNCTFARFLCLLNENKEPIAEMQSSTTIINTGNAVFIAVSFDKTTYPIENYAISFGSKSDRTDYKIELPWLFSDTNIHKILPNGVSVEAEAPAANSTLIACDYSNNVKYNKSYVYMAKFTGTIGNITLYHGSGTYGTYLRITPTNIIVNTSGTDIYNEAHQLTIADYLYIFVDTDDQNGAVIRVMSNGKLATVNVTNWQGWQGQVFALTASALTYHRLDVIFKDCNSPIWVFGDSYLSKASNERWGYYLKQWGIAKYMAVGYPGAGSANVSQTLHNMLKITQPKYLVWALGMNDPDNGDINSAWLTAANNVVALCKQYNIVPVFSKIPNANGSGTLYDHSYKNAWIEASGYRYVDVPSAVGADSSGNWFTDLLAGDGIHPSWRGAEAIAYQFLADVPELMEQ